VSAPLDSPKWAESSFPARLLAGSCQADDLGAARSIIWDRQSACESPRGRGMKCNFNGTAHFGSKRRATSIRLCEIAGCRYGVNLQCCAAGVGQRNLPWLARGTHCLRAET
jgi:hypothetical protein